MATYTFQHKLIKGISILFGILIISILNLAKNSETNKISTSEIEADSVMAAVDLEKADFIEDVDPYDDFYNKTPQEIENFRPYKEIQDKINYLLNTKFRLHDDGFIEVTSNKYGYFVHSRFNIRDMCQSYSNGSIYFNCCDSSKCIKYFEFNNNYPEFRNYLSWTCGKSVYVSLDENLEKFREIAKPL